MRRVKENAQIRNSQTRKTKLLTVTFAETDAVFVSRYKGTPKISVIKMRRVVVRTLSDSLNNDGNSRLEYVRKLVTTNGKRANTRVTYSGQDFGRQFGFPDITVKPSIIQS